MKKFADTVCRLLSIALNLFIVWAEPIAPPMSWDWGKEQMFIFTPRIPTSFRPASAPWWRWASWCASLPAGELPRWLHTLKVHCHLLPDHDLSHGGVRAGSHV